jgi:hypothetical protein
MVVCQRALTVLAIFVNARWRVFLRQRTLTVLRLFVNARWHTVNVRWRFAPSDQKKRWHVDSAKKVNRTCHFARAIRLH